MIDFEFLSDERGGVCMFETRVHIMLPCHTNVAIRIHSLQLSSSSYTLLLLKYIFPYSFLVCLFESFPMNISIIIKLKSRCLNPLHIFTTGNTFMKYFF